MFVVPPISINDEVAFTQRDYDCQKCNSVCYYAFPTVRQNSYIFHKPLHDIVPYFVQYFVATLLCAIHIFSFHVQTLCGDM